MPTATPISIVIITHNEADTITGCLRSARMLSDDIIVADTGSSDDTARLAALCGARVLSVSWRGYGAARNEGAAQARHNWILSLDADERLHETLVAALQTFTARRGVVYRFRRRNHWQERPIRFGTLGVERIARLYDRRDAHWNDFDVHEQLAGSFRVEQAPGLIEHYGIGDAQRYRQKKDHYAALSASTYARLGKKASWAKRFLAPLFNAAKSYLFLGGFLDGATGWKVARITFRYTARKYALLHRYGAHPGTTATPATIAQLRPLPSSAAS